MNNYNHEQDIEYMKNRARQLKQQNTYSSANSYNYNYNNNNSINTSTSKLGKAPKSPYTTKEEDEAYALNYYKTHGKNYSNTNQVNSAYNTQPKTQELKPWASQPVDMNNSANFDNMMAQSQQFRQQAQQQLNKMGVKPTTYSTPTTYSAPTTYSTPTSYPTANTTTYLPPEQEQQKQRAIQMIKNLMGDYPVSTFSAEPTAPSTSSPTGTAQGVDMPNDEIGYWIDRAHKLEEDKKKHMSDIEEFKNAYHRIMENNRNRDETELYNDYRKQQVSAKQKLNNYGISGSGISGLSTQYLDNSYRNNVSNTRADYNNNQMKFDTNLQSQINSMNDNYAQREDEIMGGYVQALDRMDDEICYEVDQIMKDGTLSFGDRDTMIQGILKDKKNVLRKDTVNRINNKWSAIKNTPEVQKKINQENGIPTGTQVTIIGTQGKEMEAEKNFKIAIDGHEYKIESDGVVGEGEVLEKAKTIPNGQAFIFKNEIYVKEQWGTGSRVIRVRGRGGNTRNGHYEDLYNALLNQ